MFPEKKFSNARDYCNAYFSEYKKASDTISRNAVQDAADLMKTTIESGGRIFVCGNGGSAAISNHWVCDHTKMVSTDTDLMPDVLSLSSNVELLTAIANDLEFAEVFRYQVQRLANDVDCVITVSSSGNSENIVNAIDAAKKVGAKTISLTGFDGGRSASITDVNIHVASENYGVIEDCHQSLMP